MIVNVHNSDNDDDATLIDPADSRLTRDVEDRVPVDVMTQ